MKLTNFKDYIIRFELNCSYAKEIEPGYKSLIEQFQHDYNKETLQNLTAQQMVEGNNDKGLYHRLKQETKIIGSIDVRNTNYGVFEKNGVIKPNKKFGDTVESATKNFSASMLDVLEASLSCDEEMITKNDLPSTLKYKLASIYNPDYFLPVYSIKHINFFLKCLGYEVQGENQANYFPRVHLLLSEKKLNNLTTNWSNHKFVRLLYYMFGSPNKTEEQGEVFKDNQKSVIISTDNYLDKNIVLIEEKLSKVSKKASPFNPDKKGKEKDYKKKHERNMLTGNIAEEKVMEYEKNRLEKLGKKEYVEKIEKVSDTNDSKGYDIKSFNEDGSARYIEVKSTTTNHFNFYLSENEFQAGKHYGAKFWIYFVSLGKKEIEVRQINNPFSEENLEKLFIEPAQYKVNMKFE